jgi:hypothetical protein
MAKVAGIGIAELGAATAAAIAAEYRLRPTLN